MQQDQGHTVILVLGGVRSGKSRYAQRLAEASSRVTFLATARHREDEEMRRKIERHQADRPSSWETLEVPLELGLALESQVQEADAVVIDCLTLFAANLLEAYPEDEAGRMAEVDRLCAALQSAARTVILVSNEVGSGVVPAYVSGRLFRDLVGEINQRVAAVADTVLLLIAGLPLQLKGSSMAGGR